MTRDWTRAFRRARFKGVRFWVDSEQVSVGRRAAVHEISGGEASVVEDMGRRVTEISVQAYVASDAADREGWMLEAACAAPGPGVLTLPMDPLRLAICTDCNRNRERDRGGYVAYDLRFTEAGLGGAAGIGGIGALRDAFATGLSIVASALSGAF